MPPMWTLRFAKVSLTLTLAEPAPLASSWPKFAKNSTCLNNAISCPDYRQGRARLLDVLRLHCAARSPEGAANWVDAFDEALDSLQHNPSHGLAPESHRHREDIRQRMFSTSRGLPYRLLFIVREKVVHVIHVRGPGQDLMLPDEIDVLEPE